MEGLVCGRKILGGQCGSIPFFVSSLAMSMLGPPFGGCDGIVLRSNVKATQVPPL